MRQYKIKEVELGFILYKAFEDEEGSFTVLYWNGKWWDYRRSNAKTYYFKDEALSNLILARKYGGNEPC